jgi:hypothetical protein
MAYILLVFFFASAAGHLDHIDSVRFDNEKACVAARMALSVALSGDGETLGSGGRVRAECVAAAS